MAHDGDCDVDCDVEVGSEDDPFVLLAQQRTINGLLAKRVAELEKQVTELQASGTALQTRAREAERKLASYAP